MARYIVAAMMEGASTPIIGESEAGNRAGAITRFRTSHPTLTGVRAWKAWAVDADGTPRDAAWTEAEPRAQVAQ